MAYRQGQKLLDQALTADPTALPMQGIRQSITLILLLSSKSFCELAALQQAPAACH
jgi:hypothetical protein